MITAKWTLQSGWEAPHLQPYGPLSLMPTASVLHYATECFEGMKLYRGHDGLLRLFRPDLNTRRMLSSSTRISLPAFNPDALEALLIALCARDGEKWLPKSRPGSFLYLRPTMIGSGPGLGVQVPKEALLYIIITCFPAFDEPAGTVFVDPTNPANNENTDNNITNSSHANSTANGTSNGDTAAQETAQFPVSTRKPGLRLLASKEDTIRAWPNGFGCAKLGANYGPSLIAQAEARARGYDQILWLFGAHCEVTEAGASNFFVVWRTREGKLQLVTAPLEDKIILDGITRRSVLQLAREQLADGGKREESLTGLEGLECVERKYTMGEVCEAIEEGRLEEAFAAGTAVCIFPFPLSPSTTIDQFLVKFLNSRGYMKANSCSTSHSTSFHPSTRSISEVKISRSRSPKASPEHMLGF